jgi:hypothetical protein
MKKKIIHIIKELLKEILAERNKKNSMYKVGDWVKFISDQPSVYLSRYADGNSIIRKEEHIGVIKNVYDIKKGWYSYAIETMPVQWLCHVDEGDIKQKLSEEQIKVIKENKDMPLLQLQNNSNEKDER